MPVLSSGAIDGADPGCLILKSTEFFTLSLYGSDVVPRCRSSGDVQGKEMRTWTWCLNRSSRAGFSLTFGSPSCM